MKIFVYLLLLNYYYYTFQTQQHLEDNINNSSSNTKRTIEVYACASCKLTFNTLEKCKEHSAQVV
jgi:hypothetical protein